METHIWHAKRFKMGSRWGVRYPVRCSDKSDRSTFRLVQRDSACIMDQSYYTTFEVNSERPEVLSGLSMSVFGLNVTRIVPSSNSVQIKNKDGSLICTATVVTLS